MGCRIDDSRFSLGVCGGITAPQIAMEERSRLLGDEAG
jgi:hypothetical protein